MGYLRNKWICMGIIKGKCTFFPKSEKKILLTSYTMINSFIGFQNMWKITHVEILKSCEVFEIYRFYSLKYEDKYTDLGFVCHIYEHKGKFFQNLFFFFALRKLKA